MVDLACVALCDGCFLSCARGENIGYVLWCLDIADTNFYFFMYQYKRRMLVRVDHNLLVMPEVHARPLATTTQSLVMVATLHPKQPRVNEVMLHVVLLRIALI
jgi:hypothetical protein